MAGPSQRFRLLVDPLFGNDDANHTTTRIRQGVETEYSFLEVPDDAPILLGITQTGQVELFPIGAIACRDHCCLEALKQNRRDQLLVFCPPGTKNLKINGLPASPVELLAPGDQIQFGQQVLHVTLYQLPDIGPAGEELAGKECNYCRLALRAETMVYRCRCGAVLHWEAGEADPSNRDTLQCAQNVSGCPTCERPVYLQEGYDYVPSV
jgi:hypothetical protein